MANATNYEKKTRTAVSYNTFTEHYDKNATTCNVTINIGKNPKDTANTTYDFTADEIHMGAVDITNAVMTQAGTSSGTVTIDVFQYIDNDLKDTNKLAQDVNVEFSIRNLSTMMVAGISNQSSAVGELLMQFPVYDDGTNCTVAGIQGYVYIHVYRCRVSTPPFENWAL